MTLTLTATEVTGSGTFSIPEGLVGDIVFQETGGIATADVAGAAIPAGGQLRMPMPYEEISLGINDTMADIAYDGTLSIFYWVKS